MDKNRNIIAIVEGPGDKAAVPELLRRILWERYKRYNIDVLKPRVANGKTNLIKRFEDFLRYALLQKCTAILVLLDSDKDCPVELASALAFRASALNIQVPVAVVCAKREYEAWFICSLYGSDGHNIKERLEIEHSPSMPEDVEEVRDAKAWLTDHMPSDRAYKETSDQVALTHFLDLQFTHEESRSFRRLCNAVGELVDASDSRLTTVTPN